MEGASAPKPEPGRVIEPKLEKVESFAELEKEGFRIFSLGPVYVYGNVQDDLVAAFTSERQPGRSQDVLATTALFERPVVASCKEWSYCLSIMDADNYAWFKSWMLALQLIDRKTRSFCLVRLHSAPIRDPIMVDSGKGNKAAALDIFCLSGMRGRMIPMLNQLRYEEAPDYVELVTIPPEPEVIRLGTAALEVMDGI